MMSATLVLIALCWLAIGVAAAVRWYLADDRQTVEWYQHGLGALGDITSHTVEHPAEGEPRPAAVGHVRLLSEAESSLVPPRQRRRSRSVMPPSRRRRRTPARQMRVPRPPADVPPGDRIVITTRVPDVVIDERAGDEDAPRAHAVIERAPLPPIRKLEARRRRRPRPWHVATAAGTLAVIGLVATHAHGGHPEAAHAATTMAPRRAATATPSPTTTPTTSPPAAHLALTQIDGSPSELAVVLPESNVALGVEATQRCWVEVRNGDRRGAVVFSGLVDAGQPLHVSVSNPAWVRLGNPAGVTLSLNGASLTVPGQDPVDITIAPTQPGSATTS